MKRSRMAHLPREAREWVWRVRRTGALTENEIAAVLREVAEMRTPTGESAYPQYQPPEVGGGRSGRASVVALTPDTLRILQEAGQRNAGRPWNVRPVSPVGTGLDAPDPEGSSEYQTAREALAWMWERLEASLTEEEMYLLQAVADAVPFRAIGEHLNVSHTVARKRYRRARQKAQDVMKGDQ